MAGDRGAAAGFTKLLVCSIALLVALGSLTPDGLGIIPEGSVPLGLL